MFTATLEIKTDIPIVNNILMIIALAILRSNASRSFF